MAAHFRIAARAAAARTQPQPPARILQLRPAAPRHQPLSQRLFSSSSSSFHHIPRTYRSQSRRWYSSQQQQQQQPPRNKKDPSRVAFWPFAVLIAITSGAWVLLVNKRQEMADSAKGGAPQNAAAGPTPRFDDSEVTVLFVLGGPGAGKGTQCARLVDRYNFAHLSAGDLLRAEQARPGSEFGALISDCIRNGTIVPMEVTIKLLQNAMDDILREQQKGDQKGKGGRFLIDGFPRKMDQAVKFEEDVCRAKLVLFYDCPEDVMEKRLLERGKTSGREDDNAESIRKRFRTFVETSMPVVDRYEAEGRLVRVSAAPPPDAVFKDTAEKIEERLGADF